MTGMATMDIIESIIKMPLNVSQTKYIIIGKNRYVVQIKLKRVEVRNGDKWEWTKNIK